MGDIVIQKILFKRGIKSVLESKLIGDNKPLKGEPIFEEDTGKLKVGDGVNNYKDLPYIGNGGSGEPAEYLKRANVSEDGNTLTLVNKDDSEVEFSPAGGGLDPRFIIQDPTSNQVLLYDSTLDKWVNKNLADEEAIIYLTDTGLTLQGYAEAAQGYMLVKDVNDGLVWVKPLSDEQLQQAVAAAEASKVQAGNYATAAGNSAIAANTSAQNAERINQKTMEWVNNKFWWGTLEEYNALESISKDTFYFIKPED